MWFKNVARKEEADSNYKNENKITNYFKNVYLS